MTPPCVRVEDTVLDLISVARTLDEACSWITRALAGRRAHTTAERLRMALDARAKFRWRRDLELVLGDIDAGIHSWLERQYVYRVERPHGLPAARRQVRVQQVGGARYLDNLYEAHGVCVELDGEIAHPAAQQWRDKRRDNHNLVRENILTLRFGFLDLRDPGRQCQTAAMVADLLASRALILAPVARPCRPDCPVGQPSAHVGQPPAHVRVQ